MTDVAAFTLELGSALSGLVVIAAWLFRSTAAPLAVKLALPTLMLAAGLAGAWRFPSLLGRPISTTIAALPDKLSLIAFKAIDGDKLVDLWINDAGGTRAYEIPLDKQTKDALGKAAGELAQGRAVSLAKPAKGRSAKPAGQSLTDLPPDTDRGYELDISPTLPPKD